ncbi:9082_t:CDS:2 [Ambispora gerdemannii]|uniref:9082_t:CDS:1 n=1 Tax=Ambispora gerdemannii TaxID=144530 RepID=A0A9N8YUC2_9GLOM|nr:9082_t:CDS:2 [Ambispora gerdemannii]
MLKEITCHGNQLTNLTLPNDPTNLKELDLRGNNFSGDLVFLTKATSLEELKLSNNKFTGSLDYLSNLKQLKELDISNTDLNEAYPYEDKNLNDTSLALEADPQKRPSAGELYWIIKGWHDEIRYGYTQFTRQYQPLVRKYHTFSQNTPYQIHQTAITHSKPINTKQITQLLQKIKPTSNLEEIIEIELPETSYSLEDDFGLDELNLTETTEETTSQIEIPPKGNH